MQVTLFEAEQATREHRRRGGSSADLDSDRHHRRRRHHSAAAIEGAGHGSAHYSAHGRQQAEHGLNELARRASLGAADFFASGILAARS